jgi:hypothetical protein
MYTYYQLILGEIIRRVGQIVQPWYWELKVKSKACWVNCSTLALGIKSQKNFTLEPFTSITGM